MRFTLSYQGLSTVLGKAFAIMYISIAFLAVHHIAIQALYFCSLLTAVTLLGSTLVIIFDNFEQLWAIGAQFFIYWLSAYTGNSFLVPFAA